MGMHGNHFLSGFGVHRCLGDGNAMTPSQVRYSAMSNRRSQDRATSVLAGTAYPVGTGPGAGAWQPPQKAGEMALRSLSSGVLAATLIPSRPMAIGLAGSSTFSASAALAVSMLLALAGAGSLSATIIGRLNAALDLAGSGGLAAAMTGLGQMEADLTGTGDLDALASAFGDMTIDIVVTGTGLSTANVGAAVWAALAAANNGAGTMGEKLNDAGSASNPWTEVIESGLTASDILKLIAAAAAGSATGLESGAPVFKSIDGTKDRITATYVAGTRTVTDRDVS